MNRPLLYIIHQIINRQSSRSNQKGFTLIELMIATAIGAMILSGLLFLMVDLLTSDQKDYAASETDREMQLALDFINRDLKEAVYIYDGGCNTFNTASCPSYINYVPSSLDDASSIPVLAFWKSVSMDSADIPTDAECATISATLTDADTKKAFDNECDLLQQQRSYYSLVVYVQDFSSGDTWSGRSRIVRYELPKYENIGTNILDREEGFVDPAELNGVFPTWPLIGTTANENCQLNPTSDECDLSFYDRDSSDTTKDVKTGGRGDSNFSANDAQYDVLVDYVDCPIPTDSTTCPDYDADSLPTIADQDSVTTGTQPCPSGYLPTPRDTTAADPTLVSALLSQSFFACVRSAGSGTGSDFSGGSQDVIVYIRGNAKSQNTDHGVRYEDDSFTNLYSTRITMRGVINRTHDN